MSTAPQRMKAVDLLVNSVIPEDMRGSITSYDTKGINNFLLELSRKHPELYSDVSHKLAKMGLHSSYIQGETLSLQDLMPVLDRESLFKQMDDEIAAAKKEYRNDMDEFRAEREKIWLKYNDILKKKTLEQANKNFNSIGMSVSSGARGKPAQIQAMLSTPGLYQDQDGKTIPVFIRNSFAEGLRPLEYMSGTFGARSTVISTKTSTAKGGDLLKLTNQATSRLLITNKDCKTNNGLMYEVGDQILPGRVLARDYGNYKAGTILDRQAINELHKAGIKRVIARSPLTCKADGLCAKCTGKMLDSDQLPKVGEHVGVTASTALGEPVVQGALSSKHTAGQAKGKRTYGGFEVLSQFVQSPEEYQHKATVSETAGRVEGIRDAPQGGFYVRVNEKEHYVPQGYPVLVKTGDQVEAGDQLSEGIVDVRDVVAYKGLGAARKYYANRLGEIFKDSELPAHPKNLEILARGALNTVVMDDYMEGLDALPDDAVDYNKVVSVWEPDDEEERDLDTSRGRFLSRDTLHYTAGTPLTRQVLKDFKDADITRIKSVPNKPPFTSNMERLRTASHYNNDWLAAMSTSYLKNQLMEGAERGATTNYKENIHWAPRIGYGVGFGEHIEETGKF